jgi:hypothetical protein
MPMGQSGPAGLTKIPRSQMNTMSYEPLIGRSLATRHVGTKLDLSPIEKEG